MCSGQLGLLQITIWPITITEKTTISRHCQSFYEILLIYMHKRDRSSDPSLQQNVGTDSDEEWKRIQHQGFYKFNQANLHEIPGGILRKIQDMFALLRPPSEGKPRAEIPTVWVFQLSVSPPLPNGNMGEHKLPPGVRGGARAENGFRYIWNLKGQLMAINFVFLQRICTCIHIFMIGNKCGQSSTS